MKLVGYQTIDGVYCKHYVISGSKKVNVYEDYARRKLKAIRFANLQWTFEDLKELKEGETDLLSSSSFDMDAILASCDPKHLEPPRQLIKGLLTNR